MGFAAYVENETLRKVNRMRRRRGLEPLDQLREGRMGRGHDCPIHNSLVDGKDEKRVYVTGSGLVYENRAVHVSFTFFLFVTLFDNNRISYLRKREVEQEKKTSLKVLDKSHDHQLIS